MVKKVLIATDGSESARKAVVVGSELAAKEGAELVLVHVLMRGRVPANLRHMAEIEYETAEGGRTLRDSIAALPDARFPETELIPDMAKAPDAVLRAVADKVLADAERIARAQGVSRIVKEIEDGPAADRIRAIARESQADMIVVGGHKHSGAWAWMTDSVSHRLETLDGVTCVTVH